VTEVSEEDLERLASRMAMLVSEAGEADNAGRAVAALARRLGLSGGQIKAYFLAGATDSLRSERKRGSSADAAAQIDRLERELSALRHGLKLTEVQARNAQRERDALRAENSTLIDSLDRARSAGQVRKFVGGAAVAAAILGGVVLYAGPALRPVNPGGVAERPAGSPFLRAGVVRGNGAAVLRAPEQGAALVTQLPPGARIQVRQVLWRSLVQWAEVDIGGAPGYVLSTEIDLS
jgi:hypothetical protein